MTDEQDIDLVRGAYDALGRGDVAALLASVAPDVVIRQSELVPWGGVHHGHAGYLAFLQGVQTHLDSRVEVGSLYRAGDRIVQVGRTRGTARATGRSFDAAEVHVLRGRDGRGARCEAFVDEAEFGRALS